VALVDSGKYCWKAVCLSIRRITLKTLRADFREIWGVGKLWTVEDLVIFFESLGYALGYKPLYG